jgi:hypothetical protein
MQEEKNIFIVLAVCTLIILIAFGVNEVLVTSQSEYDEKMDEVLLKLHNHPPHPLTLPISPITDEEFKLFQEVNGLSDEKTLFLDYFLLDSDKEGTIVDVDGKDIVPIDDPTGSSDL